MDNALIQQLRNKLEILKSQNLPILGSLFELAWESISKGISNSTYNSVASKLQVPRSAVEDALEAIACLYFQIYRSQLNEEQFLEAATSLELTVDCLKNIFQCYSKHESCIQDALKSSGVLSSQFAGLQWRAESELASRCLKGGLQPRVLLKLDLNRGGVQESVTLTADVPNIIRWSEMIEQALAESRTQNARRIHRAVS